MDEITTKALIIGVSIFVTLIVVTVIIFEFTQIKDIYKGVGETNVSFESNLDEFDKYRDSNNVFSGIDVKNTLAKYKNNKLVEVCVKQAELKCTDVTINESEYNKEYFSTFEKIGSKYRIKFERK